MTSVIIQFKKFPGLGRLRVVDDIDKFTGCADCALINVPCFSIDDKCGDGYHYERVKDAD